MTPVRLRCEYLSNPAGVEATAPRLEWMLDAGTSPKRGQRQTAYQIRVASSEALLAQDSADLWDSGQVDSDQSTHTSSMRQTSPVLKIGRDLSIVSTRLSLRRKMN